MKSAVRATGKRGANGRAGHNDLRAPTPPAANMPGMSFASAATALWEAYEQRRAERAA
jgi:hypothetical protein